MVWCAASGWNSTWTDVLTIPTSAEDHKLIKDFGYISLEDIKSHCATYIQTQKRKAQHQYQLYQSLMILLTKKTRLKIVKESHKYSIWDFWSGPMLYKFVMFRASIDTWAILSHIREKLASLDIYQANASINITKFNEFVTELWLNLKTREGFTHNLLTNLLEVYLSVHDSAFVAYIQRKRDAFGKGEEIDVDELMK